jgi:hypothetical protein
MNGPPHSSQFVNGHWVDRTNRKIQPDWVLLYDPQLHNDPSGSGKKKYRFNGECSEKVSLIEC